MEMSQVHNVARRLLETHGLKAEAEAGQRILEAERDKDSEKKELWRRVQSAVKEMKPAHES